MFVREHGCGFQYSPDGNILPKLHIDGADFYAKFTSLIKMSWCNEESIIKRWYIPNKELSNCVKKSIIDGADKVESLLNTAMCFLFLKKSVD